MAEHGLIGRVNGELLYGPPEPSVKQCGRCRRFYDCTTNAERTEWHREIKTIGVLWCKACVTPDDLVPRRYVAVGNYASSPPGFRFCIALPAEDEQP